MNIVADTSAWIEFLRNSGSKADVALAVAIENHRVMVPDLVYFEVLRGMPTEVDAQTMIKRFEPFIKFVLCDCNMASRAATNYRLLRAKGITVRGSIDCLIATWCIENDVPLLHADRDFAGFEQHLGLRCWPAATGLASL